VVVVVPDPAVVVVDGEGDVLDAGSVDVLVAAVVVVVVVAAVLEVVGPPPEQAARRRASPVRATTGIPTRPDLCRFVVAGSTGLPLSPAPRRILEGGLRLMIRSSRSGGTGRRCWPTDSPGSDLCPTR
jgi:hypothetical protein